MSANKEVQTKITLNTISAINVLSDGFYTNCMCQHLLSRISSAEVKPFVEQLLVNLFSTLEMQGSQENEYIMKGECVIRPVVLVRIS